MYGGTGHDLVKDQDKQLNEWRCNAQSGDSVSCTQKVIQGIYIEDMETVVKFIQKERRVRNIQRHFLAGSS